MRTTTTAVLLAALLVLVAGACDANGSPDAEGAASPLATDPPPDWLERVNPPPGSEMSATASIQATYERLGQDRNVRLLIDDVDVTQYADTDRTQLSYDPDDGRDLVDLDAGSHTATIELVTVPEFGEQHEVIDRYSWDFTVL